MGEIMNRNLYEQIDSKEHEIRKLVAKEREAEIVELLKDYQEFNIEDCQIDIYPEHDNPADNFTLEFRFHSHDFEGEDTEKLMEIIISGLPKDWIIIPSLYPGLCRNILQHILLVCRNNPLLLE